VSGAGLTARGWPDAGSSPPPTPAARIDSDRVAGQTGGGEYRYAAYGVRLGSYQPLSPLVVAEGDGEPDVWVLRGALDDRPFEAREGFQIHVAPDEIWIRHSRVGTFLARQGREIVVDALPDAEERVIRSYIVKAALAAVLLQRGKLILHASGAAIGGDGVAFVGASGMGKSTTGAALHARGHPVIADDLMGVDVRSADTPMALPGFPQVLLLPESASALGRDPNSLPRVTPVSDKFKLDAPQGFSLEPVPLRRIYDLAFGDRDAVEPLGGREAVSTLVAHTFGILAFRQGAKPAHFLLCAELVKRVPVCRLVRTRQLGRLADLARLVERDLADHD
jgi:hypothetical protein